MPCSYARVVEEEHIPVVETAGHFNGLAPFVERFKAAGVFVIVRAPPRRRHPPSAALAPAVIMCRLSCSGTVPLLSASPTERGETTPHCLTVSLLPHPHSFPTCTRLRLSASPSTLTIFYFN